MKTYYSINGVNEDFRTLSAAKYHVYIAYTRGERIKELKNTDICRVCNDTVKSITPIYVDDLGNYSFGKTKNII